MSLTIAISPSSFAEASNLPIQLLKKHKLIIKHNSYKRRLTEVEIINHLEGVDGLIAGLEPLNRKVLSSTNKLKAIARVGIGLDNIDLDAARELSIKISNTPEAPSSAVAEMTIAALLSIQRRLIQLNNDMHNSRWNKIISPGIYNKNILIIGYGRIGRKVSELLEHFGVHVFIYDPVISDSELRPYEKLVTIDEGLSQADVISLHASGKSIILDQTKFNLMQNGVVILNSARGELVDENALIDSLKSGKVAGAWFDTFRDEPYVGPLLNFDNVLLTPHVSTYTESCRLDMEIQSVKNLINDLGI